MPGRRRHHDERHEQLHTRRPHALPDGTRLGRSPNNFCTGDVNNGTANVSGVTTSYDLRNPTDTYNPKDHHARSAGACAAVPAVLSPAASGAKTGTFSGVTNTTLDSTKTATYNDELAKVYHQWVKLCTFTPTKAGDYYLQIRTNVAARRHRRRRGRLPEQPQRSTPRPATTPPCTGSGNNRFAIRATGARARLRLDRRLPGHVDLRQLQRRQHDVQPGARDPGRGHQDPQHRLLRRGRRDATPAPSRCCRRSTSNLGSTARPTAREPASSPARSAGCKLTNVSSGSGWNGKYENIKIPIPNTYNCTYAQAGGCWWRLWSTSPAASATPPPGRPTSTETRSA